MKPYVIVLALLVFGCAPNPWSMESFKNPESGGIKRAAFELGCPEQQLRVTDLGDGTAGVTGCGKKAVYKWAPGPGWVNNTGGEEEKK